MTARSGTDAGGTSLFSRQVSTRYAHRRGRNGIPGAATRRIVVEAPARAPQVHVATKDQTTANWTVLAHEAAADPHAIAFVTPNWNPGNEGGTYLNHVIGVWCTTKEQRWAVHTQDLTAIDLGTAFNVHLLGASPTVFVHEAEPQNTEKNSTYLDHPLTVGNPTALLFVTATWNPRGTIGVYNDHAIGVWYDMSRSRWAVFNQDLAPIPPRAAFNVEVVGVSDRAYVHRAKADTIEQNFTRLDHPLLNDNPGAIIGVTSNWNPNNRTGTYNPAPIGVFYDGGPGRWSIFNQNLSPMPAHAAFNVAILS